MQTKFIHGIHPVLSNSLRETKLTGKIYVLIVLVPILCFLSLMTG